jgi:phosphoglycolate phosphatase-like HAD superfamily hydrolase
LSFNGQPRAFIFDLDGTLLFLPVKWDIVKAELREVTETKDIFSPIFRSIEELLARKPRLKGQVFAILDKHEIAALQETNLSERSRDLLELLSASSRLALITLQGKKVLQELIRKFSLGQFFSAMVTREDSLDRANQLSIILRLMGLDPTDTVLVADRQNDLDASTKVGMRMILIRNQSETRMTPYRHFQSLEQLYLATSQRDDGG